MGQWPQKEAHLSINAEVKYPQWQHNSKPGSQWAAVIRQVRGGQTAPRFTDKLPLSAKSAIIRVRASCFGIPPPAPRRHPPPRSVLSQGRGREQEGGGGATHVHFSSSSIIRKALSSINQSCMHYTWLSVHPGTRTAGRARTHASTRSHWSADMFEGGGYCCYYYFCYHCLSPRPAA